MFHDVFEPTSLAFEQRGGVLDRLGDLRSRTTLDKRAVSQPDCSRRISHCRRALLVSKDQPSPLGSCQSCSAEQAATAPSVDDVKAGFQPSRYLDGSAPDQPSRSGVHHDTHGPERAHETSLSASWSRRTSRSCIPSSRRACGRHAARGCRHPLAIVERSPWRQCASVRVTGLGR